MLKAKGKIKFNLSHYFLLLYLDLLRSFHANFEFNHDVSTGNDAEVKSLGKINVNWTVTETKNVSHFILQWRSSKDLRIQQKTVASNETSSTIGSL
jgi:hypothetical protein